jgi:FlaA1/EpsC-like NDP-sugar epimerase
MEDRSPNIDVVRSVWRRVKKAKIRDLGIRDLEPVKDVKGGVTDKSKPITGGTGTIGSH